MHTYDGLQSGGFAHTPNYDDNLVLLRVPQRRVRSNNILIGGRTRHPSSISRGYLARFSVHTMNQGAGPQPHAEFYGAYDHELACRSYNTCSSLHHQCSTSRWSGSHRSRWECSLVAEPSYPPPGTDTRSDLLMKLSTGTLVRANS